MITLDSIDYSLHSIQIKDADGDALAIDASGKISAIVEATNLDIRDLAFATDKVDVTGSEVSLDSATLAALETITVNQGTSPWVIGDGGGSITVDAADLDIRDLSHSQDSVKIGDGTDFLAINADGSINAAFTEGGYSTWQVTNVSVTTTESTVSALANRIRVEIQNLGSHDIYIKQATGVSTSNGLKIPKGSSFEQTLDAGAAIYMVAASGSSDVRIAQYAA